jgi:hypothetical protein
MNIFFLNNDPKTAAQEHCDKHVVKMIVEAAQMLSTAHRMLDGFLIKEPRTNPKTGKVRMVKVWKHIEPLLDKELYQVTHPSHPSNLWTRQTRENYKWHYELFCALCDEYTYRYGKIHATDTKLRTILGQFPAKLQDGPLTPFPLAMQSQPQCIDLNDPIGSYRKFYHTKQDRFRMRWTKREVPSWFSYNK